MSYRELKATMELIPKAMKNVLPKDQLSTLLDGKYPQKGFGLGGNTGGGKTMAMAAILRACAIAQVKTYKPKGDMNFNGTLHGVGWVYWPSAVQWLRSHAIDPEANEWVQSLSLIPLLVLDDLGRERIKGSYVEDWAASQLDLIVNQRYREQLPILWTTNVTEADLLSLYGGAMLRRLTADNPLIWVQNLKVMP